MRVVAGLVMLVLAAGCAGSPKPESAAAPAAQAEASGPSPEAEKGEKLICRRLTDTGSRKPRKVCATAAEWANSR